MSGWRAGAVGLIDSDVLKIPALLPLVGWSVEIIIVEEEPRAAETDEGC